jgi:hypothetical protein
VIRRVGTVATLTFVLFGARDAGAWEGVCRVPDAQVPTTRTINDYVNNICPLANSSEDLFACKTGLDYPRGTYVGEHGWIAYIGMRWAGLESYASQKLPAYYTDAQIAFDGSNESSLIPAGIAAPWKHKVDRQAALSDLAELPDASYSFSDYLMGNEHCLPQNIDRATQDDILACHKYNSHIAIVNSTHFAPQNQHLYWVYHELARERALRCKTTAAALASSPPPWLTPDAASTYVKQCELEALSLQSVAAHYMADAWSSGHMWQRWGSPVFPPTRNAQIEAVLTGMVSGLIHGWRSVAREHGLISPLQHDQLCMPGSFTNDPPRLVQFVQPSHGNLPQNGGGDLYLLPCTASQPPTTPAPGWAVAPGTLDIASQTTGVDDGQRPLSAQYQRMMTCISHGYAEVYDDGPQTSGPRIPLATALDSVIGNSIDNACFDARVTGASMLLGAGINQESFRNTTFWSRVGISVDSTPFIAGLGGDPGVLGKVGVALATIGTAPFGRAFAAELVRLWDALMEAQANEANNGPLAADLPGAKLATFHGSPRNADSVGLIDTEQVGYIEPHAANPPDPSTPAATVAQAWKGNAHSGSCTRSKSDVGDGTCPDGFYCDRAVVLGQESPHGGCVRHETAILRAYRDGEVAAWCGDDTSFDLDAARSACAGADASHKEDTCAACVDAVAVHLRNAGDAFDYAQRREYVFGDPRSICDILKDGKALVNASFDPGTNAIYAATSSVSGNSASPASFAYDPWSAAFVLCASKNSLPTDDGAGPTAQILTASNFTCARGCGTRLWCWGSNLDSGYTYGFGRQPLFVNAPSITAASMGADTGCAIANNNVYCWGDGGSNQLGPNSPDQSSADPVLVPDLTGATYVSAGGPNSCAVVGGALWCWGHDYGAKPVHITLLPSVTLVDAASNRAVAGGTIYSWNPFQGGPTNPFDVEGPYAVSYAPPTQGPTSGTPLSGVTAYSGNCALANGLVYCFDAVYTSSPNYVYNAGTQTESLVPLPLPGTVTAFNASLTHGCAVLAPDGEVVCWGDESHGELGNGLLAGSGVPPAKVPGFSGAIAIAAGANNTCAMKANGTVWCWGAAGDVGNPDQLIDSTIPVRVSLACE